ncbi:organic cation transporter protein-like [Penaeus chinensis]|uniref:organic cation transporter protein-like n=1 Tax=Penaeus chinensis TaxID=139456 RepID=UPI001FB5A63A|nr:organic cation transporter protein-like [Penaeus chinensis]
MVNMKPEMSTFDDLLQLLGTGKWNLMSFLSICYWVSLLPSHNVGPAFLTPEVGHTCRLPENATGGGNVTNMTGSQCSYEVTTADGSTEERPCTEWNFDNATYTNTITSEFNLVCSLSFLRPTFKSISFFGALIGAPFSGWMSDRYGRKMMLSVGTVSYALLANALCWLPDIYSILTVRFLVGFMTPTSVHAGYTLSMETCDPRYRAATGILIFLPWTVSLILLGGVGFLIRDWRELMFTLSLPMFLFLPVLWFIDESPRWLIVRGRHQHALRVLQKAGRWNKVAMPAEEELYAIMENIQKEAQKTRRLSDALASGPLSCLRGVTREAMVLFRTKRIRSITLALYLDYLVLGTVYYGLSLGGDQFGVDPFVYMTLGGVMELPGSTLTIPMVQKMGRKLSSILCFLVTAGALLALGVTTLGWLGMVFTMVGKMAITAAYQIIYLYASEVFPTEVRQRGMGTATMVAKVGSVAAPFLVENLSSIGPWVPLVIFGGVSLIAAGVTLKLPETRGASLPDTVADLESSGNC